MSTTMAGNVPELGPSSEEAAPGEAGSARPLGFVGLGAMGLPMVAALVAAGHAVLACDTDPMRLSLAVDVVSAGPGSERLHTTPLAIELAARCDLILLMLPDSITVAEVTGDLASGLPAGSLIADLGASDPKETRLLAEALEARNVRLVDAPALGTPAEAEACTLSFLLAGGPAQEAVLEPILAAMGRVRDRTGPVGSAHQAARDLANP